MSDTHPTNWDDADLRAIARPTPRHPSPWYAATAGQVCDATGHPVGSATSPAVAELIVRAVNAWCGS